MHEVSVIENILEIIENNQEQQQFTSVQKICLEIGELSCIDIPSLEFCFSEAKKGTVAQNASLDVIKINGKGLCKNCGKNIEYKQLYDCCPNCQKFDIKILCGKELRVKQLIVN